MSKKPRGKHQCIEKEIEREFLTPLNNVESIKKVILGTAVNTRHSFSAGDFKFKKFTNTGMHYQAFTENGIRDIYLICQGDKKKTKKRLDQMFNKGEQ